MMDSRIINVRNLSRMSDEDFKWVMKRNPKLIRFFNNSKSKDEYSLLVKRRIKELELDSYVKDSSVYMVKENNAV